MVKTRSGARTLMLNVISALSVMIINVGISFFLSPYIIRTIGVEAKGFVDLANNFTTYANVAVTALNAMAARFITIDYVKGNYKQANLYYNSVFWGNLVIVAVLLIPAALIIGRLEYIVDVPVYLLKDVKILFGIIFTIFFLRTAAPNWECGTIVTNRLDRNNFPEMLTNLLRCAVLLTAFSLFSPKVWYIGVAALLSAVLMLVVGAVNTRKLTPELHVRLKQPLCSLKVITTLVGSGIWNSVAIVGNMFMESLDLLVCNLSISATAMGVLAVSKSFPAIITTLSETMRGTFGAEMTIEYAKGDKERLLASIRRAMKINSVLVTVPAVGVMVMSGALYRLWVPSLDARLLQTLTVLAMLKYVFFSGATVLNNVFPTVNKVKYNSIAMIVMGLSSILTTLVLVHYTEYGIYAVAGVSSVMAIIKNFVFMLPVTAKLLGYKWYQFFPQVGTSVLCFSFTTVIALALGKVLPTDTWLHFFLTCALIGVLGLTVNMMIVLNKEERKLVLSRIKNIIKR